MIVGEDYKFRDDIKESTVPIELLTGPYKGVIVRFVSVGIKEQQNDSAVLSFQYVLHAMGDFTETQLRVDKRFETHIGTILNCMILEVADADKEPHEHRKSDSKEPTQEQRLL